jgi:O-antigen/teichoic acid export membrane protein
LAETKPNTEQLPPRMRFVSVVWRLTSANALIAVLALVTSPILARALGPSGRGELAAIFTVLTLAPWITDLGLTAYLTRERARGEDAGLLLGSVMPLAVAGSVIGVAAAIPVAHLLGQGREDVIFFLEIGLLTLPVGVFIGTLYGLLVGEERWRVIVGARVLNAALPAAAIVGLSLVGAVTVPHVAIAYLVTTIVGNAPYLLALRRSRPWKFRRKVSVEALAFGVKSWLATVAITANARLDQLFMAGLVSSTQLGLYALAVTLSSVSSSLVGAVSNAVFPRIALGEAQLGARACRLSMAMVLVFNLLIGASSPFLVPVVFGADFSGAVPMLLILLVASVCAVGVQILTSIVTAGGDPAATARAQGVGLAITIPGLVFLLPSFGGIGAAWISLASYTASLIIVLRAAVALFDLPFHRFLLPHRSDWTWLRGRLASIRARRAGDPA